MTTEFIDTETGEYPISEQDIRAAFPNTIFHEPFSPPERYAVVFAAPVPAFDALTQATRKAAPVQTSKGHYEQTWEVVALPAKQVAANQARALDALVASITSSAQNRLDTWALAHGYDSIISLASYAIDPDPIFSAEGKAGVEARSSTWAALRKIMEDVKTGARPVPSSYSAIESELPPLVWPE